MTARRPSPGPALGTCGPGGQQRALDPQHRRPLGAKPAAGKVCRPWSSPFSRSRSPAGAACPHAPPAAAGPWSPQFRSSAEIRAPPARRAPACSPTAAAGSRAGPSPTATAARAPRTRRWSPRTSPPPSRSSSRRSTPWCSSWAWWETPWSCS